MSADAIHEPIVALYCVSEKSVDGCLVSKAADLCRTVLTEWRLLFQGCSLCVEAMYQTLSGTEGWVLASFHSIDISFWLWDRNTIRGLLLVCPEWWIEIALSSVNRLLDIHVGFYCWYAVVCIIMLAIIVKNSLLLILDEMANWSKFAFSK